MINPKIDLHKVSASSDTHPIRIRFSIPTGRVEYHIGVSIGERFFNVDYQNNDKPIISKKYKDATYLNNYIRQIETYCHDLETLFRAKGIEASPKDYKKELDERFKNKKHSPVPAPNVFNFSSYFKHVEMDRRSGKRRVSKGSRRGQPYSKGYLSVLKSTYTALSRYCNYENIPFLKFEDINMKFYESFQEFCYSIEDKEINTFGNYIRDIKNIMTEANDEGVTTANGHLAKGFIKPDHISDTIALTREQLDKIHAVPLDDEKLNRTRDLFLIGCYSALRYSDLKKVTIEAVEGNFLRIKQNKTGNRVTIPIMSKLKEILDKYPDGFDFKGLYKKSYNKNIKEIIKESGLKNIVEYTDTKGGKTNIVRKPFYNLVSSHTARRTYATVLFKEGVPTLLIMGVTGHKTESSFLRYIRATNEEKALLMADVLKKLNL